MTNTMIFADVFAGFIRYSAIQRHLENIGELELKKHFEKEIAEIPHM